MPDQIAHIVFAHQVVAAADERLRRRICPTSAAFRAGTFGPDPLFNDPSPRRRAEGFDMHHRSGREALERMRRPIGSGMPWAADYAAGFLCHYALDRLCHPEIKAMAAEGKIGHLALETAYDRILYLRGNRDLPRRIGMSRSALQAAAQMYTRLNWRQYRTDLEIYWQMRRFLIFGGGTKLAKLPACFDKKLDGLIPYAEITPDMEAGIAMLDRRMEESIQPVAEQLNHYFDAIDAGLPLEAWLEADFSGI